jgi:hypothetical protein
MDEAARHQDQHAEWTAELAVDRHLPVAVPDEKVNRLASDLPAHPPSVVARNANGGVEIDVDVAPRAGNVHRRGAEPTVGGFNVESEQLVPDVALQMLAPKEPMDPWESATKRTGEATTEIEVSR